MGVAAMSSPQQKKIYVITTAITTKFNIKFIKQQKNYIKTKLNKSKNKFELITKCLQNFRLHSIISKKHNQKKKKN